MYKAPRGTTDILPAEQPYWRYVERQAEAVCQLYGYQRIETPMFEDSRLFVRSIGQETDIVGKEMYTFEDRSGDSMTLRPEGTAPVCRAYLERGMQSLHMPVKLYYFASVFRYERPQAGRFRQHHQFGFEAIGEADPALDAEVIDMAWQLYLSLGFKNLSLVMNSIGCKKCRPVYLRHLKEYYYKHVDRLCPDCKRRLEQNPLRLLDCKQPACHELAEGAPKSSDYLCAECAEHFQRLKKHLSTLGISYQLDHRLVRGLDYYTRTVFEVQPEIEGAQSTMGGGGRYDDLVEELGGAPTPAVGFATGMERIVLNLKRQNIAVPPIPGPVVFMAHMGEPAKDAALKLATELRHAGVAVLMSLGERSLRAQLRQANTVSARYTLILGQEEVESGQVQVRDMGQGTQERVPSAGIVAELARRLKPS